MVIVVMKGWRLIGFRHRDRFLLVEIMRWIGPGRDTHFLLIVIEMARTIWVMMQVPMTAMINWHHVRAVEGVVVGRVRLR